MANADGLSEPQFPTSPSGQSRIRTRDLWFGEHQLGCSVFLEHLMVFSVKFLAKRMRQLEKKMGSFLDFLEAVFSWQSNSKSLQQSIEKGNNGAVMIILMSKWNQVYLGVFIVRFSFDQKEGIAIDVMLMSIVLPLYHFICRVTIRIAMKKIPSFQSSCDDVANLGCYLGIEKTIMAGQTRIMQPVLEKKGISLEGGCLFWLANDFSFNHTNNPLQKWKQETIFVAITFNGGYLMLKASTIQFSDHSDPRSEPQFQLIQLDVLGLEEF
ncbi:hypothetical protein H5410_059194 [Solanum commersonii]|uniref:Uncharacterized protein n=1 Tax=Solanum commersonii TaxID=4109 RepID=A0A9J5W282_SOLCO|nr:hypothetical protein H5410_059194 [Solanum commersonii]